MLEVLDIVLPIPLRREVTRVFDLTEQGCFILVEKDFLLTKKGTPCNLSSRFIYLTDFN